MKRHLLLAILAVALMLRLTAALAVTTVLDRAGRDFLIPGDAHGYWLLAGTIRAGEDYAIYDPPRRVMRMPGFPATLALFRLLTGDSLLGTRCLLAGVGTACCGALFLLGRLLVSETVGLVAAAAAAVSPVFIGMSVLVLTETLFALGLLLSLATMARIIRNRGATTLPAAIAWGILAGGMIALTSYVRPTWLPAAVIFPLALVCARRSGRSAITAAAIVVTAAIAMLPWAWRNQAVTGHWVVTTLWVGPSLYDGLNPRADGGSDMRFFENDRLLDRMSEYEMDRAYRERAWEFARQNPGRTLALAANKLWRFWRPWPVADAVSNWVTRIAAAAFYLPMLALALAGAYRFRHDGPALALTLLPILLMCLIHMLFVGSMRYRIPGEYPLWVLAATGAVWLVPHARKGAS